MVNIQSGPGSHLARLSWSMAAITSSAAAQTAARNSEELWVGGGGCCCDCDVDVVDAGDSSSGEASCCSAALPLLTDSSAACKVGKFQVSGAPKAVIRMRCC